MAEKATSGVSKRAGSSAKRLGLALVLASIVVHRLPNAGSFELTPQTWGCHHLEPARYQQSKVLLFAHRHGYMEFWFRKFERE